MKGLVFTEFLQLIEETHGIDCVDRVIDACALSHGGAYTSVGDYEIGELGQLAAAYAQECGESIQSMLKTYGIFLIARLESSHAAYFEEAEGSFAFLKGLDGKVREEVRNLYPEANLPRIAVLGEEGASLTLAYREDPAFAPIIQGMIEGLGAIYGEDLTVQRSDARDATGPYTEFAIARVDMARDPERHFTAA